MRNLRQCQRCVSKAVSWSRLSQTSRHNNQHYYNQTQINIERSLMGMLFSCIVFNRSCTPSIRITQLHPLTKLIQMARLVELFDCFWQNALFEVFSAFLCCLFRCWFCWIQLQMKLCFLRGWLEKVVNRIQKTSKEGKSNSRFEHASIEWDFSTAMYSLSEASSTPPRSFLHLEGGPALLLTIRLQGLFTINGEGDFCLGTRHISRKQ